MMRTTMGRLVSTAVALAAVLGVAALGWGAEGAAQGSKYRVYFGTYTGAKSQGIYTSEFDAKTGKLTEPVLAAELKNPSFVALHPSGKYLYAVGELENFNGPKTGAVSALAIDSKSGKLTLLNQQPTKGAGPCHVSVNPQGTVVAIATYGGGTVCTYPLKDDGSLGEMTGFAQHEGMSVSLRQKGPHAHSVNFDAAGRYAFVADLGLDKVLIYKVGENGSLEPNDPPAADVAAGSGPRHFAFHPNGKQAYAINELALTINTFDYDPKTGKLTTIQVLSTLPEGTRGSGLSTAEVQVHPSGKFVYGSNRGHDTIAVFQRDPQSGNLKLVQNQGEGVSTPRNFGVDPTGSFVLVANQSGDSVVVFKVDQETGKLLPTGEKIAVGAPVCVKFLPLE